MNQELMLCYRIQVIVREGRNKYYVVRTSTRNKAVEEYKDIKKEFSWETMERFCSSRTKKQREMEDFSL